MTLVDEPRAASGDDGAGLAAGLSTGAGSVFEPVAVVPRYQPPRAWIHPDRSRGWIRRLLPVLRSHRILLIGGFATSIVAMLAQVAIPAVTRNAIDHGLIDRTSDLAPYIWMLVALGVARALLVFVYRYCLYRLAFELEFDLRNLLYEHLTRLSFSFFDRVQSGQIISRANSDIRSVQMFSAFAPLMVLTTMSFAVGFAFMLSINVPLTLVAVAPLPFVYLVGIRLRNETFPLSWVIQARLADMASTVEENVSGVRVVKSFAAEERQLRKLAREAQRLRWASARAHDARGIYAPIMENLPRLGLAGVLLYGGLLAIDGEVTVGTLFAFNAYVVLLQAPFRLLGFFLIMGQRAAASAGRIYELLDEQPAVADRPGAVDLVDPVGEVTFEDVSFRYGDDGPLVLDHLDLHVAPGETVAIVGRTGSGKSTIARLLTRFYEPQAGRVLVDGHDVQHLTMASLRAAVSTVLDEPFLFSTSVRENIAYARPDADDETIRAAAAAAQAHDFVEELADGYDEVVGERGYTLSGGQRQRLAIARTLVANPRVLILDDATSAVDVGVEAAIHRALDRLLEGRTTILIAHRLSTIALADRVLLLDGGRIVAQGTHRELLRTEPRYAAILADGTIDADAGSPV